ncbi:hypothetical protein ACWOWW_004246, partial [Vibrio vulnificus]
LSNFGLVGKLAFGGRCFLDSYFVGAKNSENCLIEIQCACESNEAALVLSLSSSFLFLTLKLKVIKTKFMI